MKIAETESIVAGEASKVKPARHALHVLYTHSGLSRKHQLRHLAQEVTAAMWHSVGVDIVEVPRIKAALDRWGDRFLRRVYTPAEVVRCRGRVAELAARFAGKEAISKALGTGLRGVAWREMEILNDRRGKPFVRLHGRAAARAEALGLKGFAISLTHEREFAIAFVVASDHDEEQSAI